MAEEQKECNENIEAISQENNEINTVIEPQIKPENNKEQNDKEPLQKEEPTEKLKPKRIHKTIQCELCNKTMLETSFPKHYERCQIKQAKPKIETRPLRKKQ